MYSSIRRNRECFCQSMRSKQVKEAVMIAGGLAVKEPHAKLSRESNATQHVAADDPLHQVRESLRGLRYGSVNIIVQDGVIIQIDRTEKKRLQPRRVTQAGQ